jgi:hypothetical protein
MLRTLRENGGAFASAPVFAVIGRRGAPLAARTHAELSKLGVTLVRAYEYNDASWFNYSNKVAAVSYAQEHAQTPTAVWLDSDILIVREPSGIVLKPDEDFAARCEFLPPAVHQGSTEHVPYWRELCVLLHTGFDRIPWIDLDWPRCTMRLFFNSGVFGWRRASSFAASYREGFKTLLRSRLAMHGGHIWYADQVILAPIAIRDQLRWRHLSVQDHHMMFQNHLTVESGSPPMTQSRMVHYSKALDPPHRALMLERLQRELPDLGQEVAAYLSVNDRGEARGIPSPRKVARHLRLRWNMARGRRAPRG